MASHTPGWAARFFAAYEKSAGTACSRLRASTNASTGCERMASCARSATISSASPERTARISARSAGARCAPPVHTAIFRSRVARPCRRSSSTSGLSASTGLPPQIFLSQHYCTGGAGRAERPHGLAVQFQQYSGGIPRGHLALLLGRKETGLSRRQLSVQQKSVVGKEADARGRGGGDGKLQTRGGEGLGRRHV